MLNNVFNITSWIQAATREASGQCLPHYYFFWLASSVTYLDDDNPPTPLWTIFSNYFHVRKKSVLESPPPALPPRAERLLRGHFATLNQTPMRRPWLKLYMEMYKHNTKFVNPWALTHINTDFRVYFQDSYQPTSQLDTPAWRYTFLYIGCPSPPPPPPPQKKKNEREKKRRSGPLDFVTFIFENTGCPKKEQNTRFSLLWNSKIIT